jgi:Tol biopolymer transport system component
VLGRYRVTASVALALASFGCDTHSETVARQRLGTGGSESGAGGLAGDGDGDGTAGSRPGDGDGESAPPVGGASGVGPLRFKEPQAVAELNDPNAKDQDPTVTADQLEIFYFSDRAGDADIWTATRESAAASWGPPEPVVELNSAESEQNPAISRDGLRLWYYSSRDPVGVYFAERPTRADPFSAPLPITISAAAASDGFAIAPSVDVTELRMAVSIGASDSRDLYEIVRASPTGSWGEAAELSGTNTTGYAESTPFLIDEGRELLFHSGRSGSGDLFWAYREAPGLPFTQVAPLTGANDPASFDTHPHLTVDRKWLYFGSTRGGNTDIYVAEVLLD